jgi:AraC family transcriptional activator of tynA and feaB
MSQSSSNASLAGSPTVIGSSATSCPIDLGVGGPALGIKNSGEWAADVAKNFFPFTLQPCYDDDFHVSSTFKRDAELSIGAVHVDPHIASVSRSNRHAAESGMTKLMWMLDGYAEIEQDDWSWDLHGGQWVAYDIDRPYRFRSSVRSSFITMVCHRNTLGLPSGICNKPTTQPIENLSLVISQLVGSALRSDVALGRRCLQMLAYGAQQCIIESQAQLASAGNQCALHARLVADAKHYIQRNLHDPDMCADSIARELGISRRTLYSAFATISETPAKAIQHARLSYAYEVLRDRTPDSHNITDLAMNAGFADAAHFCRVYKKKFGETPTGTRNGQSSPSVNFFDSLAPIQT